MSRRRKERRRRSGDPFPPARKPEGEPASRANGGKSSAFQSISAARRGSLLTFGKINFPMKTKMLSVAIALIASALAIVISYVSGARGEALKIIAILTVVVSCCTSFAAASLAVRSEKKKQALG